MTGTPWITINGNGGLPRLLNREIEIMDREGGALYRQIWEMQSVSPGHCLLSYYTLEDLGLSHGSTTPDIFNAAIESGAKIVPYDIALRTLVEHPNIFRTSFLQRLLGRRPPFPSCLIGIKPLIGPSGKKYVIELGEIEGGLCLRFRDADENESWPEYEYWVFGDYGTS